MGNNYGKEVKKGSRLTSIEKSSCIILLVLTVGSVFFKSRAVTLGVFFGGAITVLNFFLLCRIIEGVVQKRADRTIFIIGYIFKFSGLLTIIFLLIYFGVVNTIGLVIGLSTVFIGIGFDVFVQACNFKKRDL